MGNDPIFRGALKPQSDLAKKRLEIGNVMMDQQGGFSPTVERVRKSNSFPDNGLKFRSEDIHPTGRIYKGEGPMGCS